MATLNVQNDTGTTASANCYISLADADTYFEDRNNATWAAATDANKNFAIINGWQYMDYSFTFIGLKLTEDQTTQWPRCNAFSRDGYEIEGIPTAVKYANAEYALRALSGDLLSDITYDSNKVITRQKNKVGPVEQDTEYGDYVISRSYPSADLLLQDLILSNMTVTRG